jgi:DNA-directed RNA polymerase specialized sigma24 family protein
VGQDKQPDDEQELLAAFSALGGPLTWDELARLLGCDEQALLGLSFRQRQAVVLCKQTGLSEKQAAKEMGISTGAVRAHLARGLQTLGQ